MRYLILRPPSPVDPRNTHIKSIAHLHEVCPIWVECDHEREAVDAVWQAFPNAVAMPVPFKVGSGTVMLLGVLKDVSGVPIDPALISDIPFVLLVQAVPEHSSENAVIAKRQQFSRRYWQAPVLQPIAGITSYEVELRASDLDNPARLPTKVGRSHDGKLVIYVQLRGIEMSMTFIDPAVGMIFMMTSSTTSG